MDHCGKHRTQWMRCRWIGRGTSELLTWSLGYALVHYVSLVM